MPRGAARGTGVNDSEANQANSTLASAAPTQPWPTSRQAWYGVTIFALTVMTLFGSAALMGLLMQSIKLDLGLTDTEVSLLVGFASAAFNAIASLPISRLIDRFSRRLIIGVGLAAAGIGSALTGLANGFWQIFAARLFGGIGGAGNGPATYSLLADYFPPARLPKAIAFMNFGFTSGTGLALLLGGTLIAALSAMPDTTLPLIGPVRPWQLVFLVMAIPDLILALLMLTTVHEAPRRGRMLGGAGNQNRAVPIRTVVAHLWQHREAFGPMFLGLALNSLAMGGTLAWAAPFYERTYGWGPAQYGIIQGFVTLLIAPMGLAFGGWLAEHWARQGRDDANLRVVALAAAAHMPFAIAYALMPNPYFALAASSLSTVLVLIGAGPQNAALQTIVPNEMRGQLTALFLFLFTMIGLGIAPTVVALLTDLVFQDESRLRYSIAAIHAVMAPAALIVFLRGLPAYGRAVAQARGWQS
jgi:MFS family permease